MAKRDVTGKTKQEALDKARAAGKDMFIWDGVKFSTKPMKKTSYDVAKPYRYGRPYTKKSFPLARESGAQANARKPRAKTKAKKPAATKPFTSPKKPTRGRRSATAKARTKTK